MAQHDSKTDFSQVAEAVEESREVIRALVAGLIADGFDDAQARDIVAGMFRNMVRDTD